MMFFSTWSRRVACRILVPQPGIEPVPPVVEVQSLNHWTAKEVPEDDFYVCVCVCVCV